ncbi:MAG: hypothetical protein AABX16_02635 [Nanoarchaeota archaeon]
MKKACPDVKITVKQNREIIDCDALTFPWRKDPAGYFLVKLEKGLICCGFVNNRHEIIVEFRGRDPDKIIKEIVRRNLCDRDHIGYIASELMIAHDCLIHNKKYVQR